MKQKRALALIFTVGTLACSLAGLPVGAQEGPSFDCRNAGTPDEEAICASPELAALDRRYSQAYDSLRDTGQRERALTAARNMLRLRRECEASARCIREVLIEAIEVLAAAGAQVPAPAAPPPGGSKPAPGEGSATHGKSGVAGTVLRGRCHMGVCTFSQVQGIVPEAETATGELKKLTTIGAQVEAEIGPDKVPRYDGVTIPDFEGPESVMYVHCSTSRPAVMGRWGDRERWIVHPLDVGNPDAVFGFNAFGHAVYWFVCHGANVPADEIYTEMQVREAVLHGYRASWGWSSETQLEFETFRESFDFLGARGG